MNIFLKCYENYYFRNRIGELRKRREEEKRRIYSMNRLRRGGERAGEKKIGQEQKMRGKQSSHPCCPPRFTSKHVNNNNNLLNIGHNIWTCLHITMHSFPYGCTF